MAIWLPSHTLRILALATSHLMWGNQGHKESMGMLINAVIQASRQQHRQQSDLREHVWSDDFQLLILPSHTLDITDERKAVHDVYCLNC